MKNNEKQRLTERIKDTQQAIQDLNEEIRSSEQTLELLKSVRELNENQLQAYRKQLDELTEITPTSTVHLTVKITAPSGLISGWNINSISSIEGLNSWLLELYDNEMNDYAREEKPKTKTYRRNRPVYQTDLSGDIIQRYPNTKIASEITKIGYKNINAVLNGIHDTANGYRWFYAD